MKKVTSIFLSISILFLLVVPISHAKNLNTAPVIESVYDNATIYDGTLTFSEGLAWVVVDYKAGVINTSGDWIVEPKYEFDIYRLGSYRFSEGLSRVYDKKWKFINTKGEVVIETNYQSVKDFSEGLAAVKKNNLWGFIDHNGKEVIKPQYQDIGGILGYLGDGSGGFNEGLIAVKKNGKWGYIDKSGKTVIKFQYYIADNFNEGIARVYLDENTSSSNRYINKTGKIVLTNVTSVKFTEVTDFHDGLAIIVDPSGYWGVINKKGKKIVKPTHRKEYETISPFSEGMAVVQTAYNYGSLYGSIDKTGKLVIKPKYSDMKDFHEGLAVVGKKINGTILYGFIDKTGKEVIKPQYANAGSFNSGLALVQDSSTLKYGFIHNPLK
ncbi:MULTISPECIES: WG repeat-containing protein [Paenibacillus]|uniref:WG repeat-containing protein n=1 Tax=Paenibacillus vandeheii TaxID=3035917 RepID=A0ABT8JFV1_9BACL|nr:MULTISPECIES: WG repeat-containing protein [Paenibacillus]MDN4603964.1 WG repeat-containing protein [Paenibacillus vandeheii]